jgi:spore coat protein U-like protein
MDLAPGDYSIEVTDNEGCFIIDDVTISTSDEIEIETEITNSECNLAIGRIVVTASNGTGPYTYSIDSGPFQSNNTFDNLASGMYTIQVKDALDCVVSEMVNIQDLGTLSFMSEPTNSDCGMANGQIEVNVSGGSSPYRYSLDGGAFQSSNVFSNLDAATYTITVEDNIGCALSSMIEVLDETTLSLHPVERIMEA